MQDQPIGYYTKQTSDTVPSVTAGVPSLVTTTLPPSNAGFTPLTPKNNKKLFGQDRRKILGVLGLFVFLLVASLGVYISLRQRLDNSQLAPNAPESRPSADVTRPDGCTLVFEVPSTTPTPTPVACAQAAFTDAFTGTALSAKWRKNGLNERRTVALENNQLVLKVLNNSVTEAVGIDTTDLITGDFDTEIDVTSLTTSPNEPNGTAELVLSNSESYTYISLNRLGATSLNISTNNATNNIWKTPQSFITTSDNVRFKIVRTGTVVTTFYKLSNSSEFVQLGSYTTSNTPIKAVVHTHSTENYPDVTATFDNFVLRCPITVVAPLTCQTGAFNNEFTASTELSAFTSLGSGTATVTNGKLNFVVPARPANDTAFDPREAIETKKPISGVFETSLTVTSFTSPNDNQGSIRLNVDSGENTQNREAIALVIEKKVGSAREVIYYYDPASDPNVQHGTPTIFAQSLPATGNVTLKIERLANNTVVGSYNIGNGFVKLGEFTNYTKPLYVRPALRSDGANTITALGAVSASIENFILACPTPVTPTYSCNSICTTDANCQTVNSGYVCSTIGSEKRCRLSTNSSSVSCSATPGVTPTPSVTPTPGVTPTPAIGCNDTCINNSDCSNPDHICHLDRCRLGTNPTSTSCTLPVATPTPTIGCGDVCANNSDCSNASHICYNNTCRLGNNPDSNSCAPVAGTTPITVAGQPELPAELPQTGPADWANWLKVGLGVVVLGAVMLLVI